MAAEIYIGSMKGGKGQMLLEFVIATLIFFAILFYITSLLNANVSRYSLSAAADSLEAKAVRVSEQLLSIGLWDNGTPSSPGLLDNRSLIDYERVSRFKALCNDYIPVQRMLGLTSAGFIGKNAKDFFISIIDNKKKLLECGKSTRPATSAHIRRYALSQNNTVAVLEVFVW